MARRNFLFTGSPRGGERLAAAFTLVDGCLLLGLDLYEYLVDVIRKLEDGWAPQAAQRPHPEPLGRPTGD